jgi:hypothetical protein
MGNRNNSAPRVSADAIPRPPRMPSLGPGQPGAASGTRRVEMPAASGDEFPPEEPSSFDTRRTPVVPAHWPEQDAAPRPTEADAHIEEETAPPSDASLAAGPVAPAPPSDTSSASEPVAPLAGSEVAFFEAPPQYSVTPPVLVSEAPRVASSLLRSIVTKMLFALITGATLLLLFYEASVATHTPSLDPRRLVSAVMRG